MPDHRVGIGFDAHRFAEGRKLVLGGTEVPYHLGLLGHSDADVLTHAIMDALLGAANLGDLGTHFPSSDPRYKDIPSQLLLREVVEKLHAAGWHTINLDATIVTQEPRLSSHIDSMKNILSQTLGVPAERVSIKATTSDGMGFTGRGEGIAALAVALIEKAE